MEKGIVILGSTGSVGITALSVISQYPHRFRLVALTGQKNLERLFQQCVEYCPKYAILGSSALAKELDSRLKKESIKVEVLTGLESLNHVVALPEVDIVVSAIVGAAGLLPTLSSIRSKKRVLLANKEALVMAGSLLIPEVQRNQVEFLPLDSEHNAIFQCLGGAFKAGFAPEGVGKIILTASGGPFRQFSKEQLEIVTPDQACHHPTWSMGKKISVDSATMMNKGFEVIEAHWLFGLKPEDIEVVVHPQSIMHSLVEYVDGSVMAQLGIPDMRLPIAYSLGWPERLAHSVKRLNVLECSRLEFFPLDEEHYPCFRLAYQALREGGTAPAILNASNEVAVESFLESRIRFTDIARVNQEVLNKVPSQAVLCLDDILEHDAIARKSAYGLISKTAQ